MLATEPVGVRSSREALLLRVLRTVLPLLIILGGIGGAVALYALKEKPVAKEITVQPPLVQTLALMPHDGHLTVEVDGLVVPHREVKLSAEVGGRVLRKSPELKAGRFVTRGQRLLEIDPRDYELDKLRLTKEYKQAETMLDELEVELAQASELLTLATEDLTLQQREHERVRKLAHVLGQSDVDRAKRAELAARNSEAQLRNQVRMLDTRRSRLESGKDLVAAQLEKAERDLARTTIEAPMDGVIIEETVEEDSFVQKGAPLLTVEDVSAVEVRCQLRMEELFWLWRQGNASADSGALANAAFNYEVPQTPATVIYEIGGERFAWSGMLSRFDGIGLDERTRTLPCRVLVSNPRDVKLLSGEDASAVRPPALVRGMYVTVQLHVRPQTPLWRVPESALRPSLTRAGGGQGQRLNAVWIVRAGKLVVEPVEVAGVEGSDVVLSTAPGRLVDGDQIVVTPLAEAVSGMQVRVDGPQEPGRGS